MLHPLLSIAFRIYVPAPRLLISSVVSLLLHRYVNGGDPPLIVTSIKPSFARHALTSLSIAEIFIANGSSMLIVLL